MTGEAWCGLMANASASCAPLRSSFGKVESARVRWIDCDVEPLTTDDSSILNGSPMRQLRLTSLS